MRTLSRPTAFRGRLAERELADWLHHLDRWALSVTLTFRRKNRVGLPITTQAINDTSRLFIRRLNEKCYGRRFQKRGMSLGVVSVISYGRYGEHPHAHYSLTVPEHLSYSQMREIVSRCARRLWLTTNQDDIQPYRDAGWSEYLAKHGCEALILEQTSISCSAS